MHMYRSSIQIKYSYVYPWSDSHCIDQALQLHTCIHINEVLTCVTMWSTCIKQGSTHVILSDTTSRLVNDKDTSPLSFATSYYQHIVSHRSIKLNLYFWNIFVNNVPSIIIPWLQTYFISQLEVCHIFVIHTQIIIYTLFHINYIYLYVYTITFILYIYFTSIYSHTYTTRNYFSFNLFKY